MEKFCWVKFEPDVKHKEDVIVDMANQLTELHEKYNYQPMQRLPDGEFYLYREEAD